MALVDEVKAKLSIVDVVSDYVTLQNASSRNPKALCPFHEERTPSFTLYPDQGSWRCYGACADGGDIFSFVMRADGIEFTEALDKLCEMAGIERRNDFIKNSDDSPASAIHKVNSIAEEFFHRQLLGKRSSEALEYLESRGIDAETARRRGIGFAPGGVNSLFEYLRSLDADSRAVVDAGLVVTGEDGKWRDMFTNRITISIRDARNNIIGFGARAMGDAHPKYLNTHATSIFDKSTALYGINWATEAIRATGQAIIVEGYMDVIAAQEHGFKNVVACMGTAVTPQQLRTLAKRVSDNEQRRSVVLCLDSDAAGQQATMGALRNAIAEFGSDADSNSGSPQQSIDIRIATPVTAEDGAPKDPDEAIRHNPAEWHESISSAVEIIDFIIDAHATRHDLGSDGGIDELLTELEPCFSNMPPHTIADMRRLRNLATRLNLDESDLTRAFTLRRSARISSRSGSTSTVSTRRRSRRVPNSSAAAQPVPVPALQAPWERILMACIAQYDFAIDHAQFVDPDHFNNRSLGALLEHMRASQTFLSSFSPSDEAQRALLDDLKHHPLTPDADVDIVSEADIIAMTKECARRTLREFLIRQKREEAAEARKHGNLIPKEIVKSAVEKNEQIRQLSSV